MFSNFLYFLVALVIYTSSQLFEPPKTLDPDNWFYFLALSGAFVLACRFLFHRLSQKAVPLGRAGLDQQVNRLIRKLSVTALAIYAASIYVFKLDQWLLKLTVFEMVPTFAAVLFLGLFLFYLVVIWNFAFKVQSMFFPGRLTKKDFLVSHISFSLPALLPWFCLSLTADLIGFLPFEGVKAVLTSPFGEIGYILLALAVMTVFGPFLIRKLWRCVSLEAGPSREMIEQVCQKAGLKYRDILKWELFGGAMITAGVMGVVSRFRYILVTPALLNTLSEDEIEAVIFHEIGHVQKHHMLYYLMFFAGFIAINFLFFEPLMLLLYTVSPAYAGFSWLGIQRSDAHAAMITITLIACFILYFRFAFGYFMRNFERQADIHIFRFKPDVFPMISTFQKIAFMTGQSPDKPNWHHYSIGQRVDFLQACSKDPSLVLRHHVHVKRLIWGYLLLVTLVCAMGYSVSYGVAKEPFSQFVTQKIVEQELELDPDNSDLYAVVGDYHYDQKAYGKAVEAYENVIRIDPENVHALNNLAWLYATCPEEQFQNRERALELAATALSVERPAYVLDTYAEALFVNSKVDQAVEAAKEALAAAGDKKSYYREQVQRFTQSLKTDGKEGH